MNPSQVAGSPKIVLEYSRVREIGWADGECVPWAINVGNRNLRELVIPGKGNSDTRGCDELLGACIGHFTDKPEGLLPPQVWIQNGRIVERHNLTSSVHRCRKAERGTVGECISVGIPLVVILPRQPDPNKIGRAHV